MYGKIFASTFGGSMFGAGPDVFAVWSYIIANTVKSKVELNPRVLGAAIGTTPERVSTAIEFLCQPDPNSRNADFEGRRLVHEGQFLYFVVSHEHYRAIRNEDDRRAYNAQKMREHRARVKGVKRNVIDGDSL